MGFRNPAVWMILILLVILLFGASRLPDITRNLGKSLKIFKEEVQDLSGEKTIEHNDNQSGNYTAPQQPQQQQNPESSGSGQQYPPQAPNPQTPPQAEQYPPAEGN